MRGRKKPLLIIIFVFLIGFFIVLYCRTLTLKSPKVYKDPKIIPVTESNQHLLGSALSIQTLSIDSVNVTLDLEKYGAFEEFIAFLNKSFPIFHQTCKLVKINSFGLLYSWEPKSAVKDLLPILLMAHYDVVPVEVGTEKKWKYPAFDGRVEEGKIWGRGAIDIKSQLIAHMIAVEKLIKEGVVPKRTFYFAYGFDEELGGTNGAKKIAEYLLEKKIRFEGVLDEGGCVSDIMRGVKAPLAMVGVAEKGHCDYAITVGTGVGGHSGMPPAKTALGYAGRLMVAMESNPMPAHIIPTMLTFFDNIGGEMRFMHRLVISNIWLFKPLLLKYFSRGTMLNAFIRTTTTPTMCHGADAPNSLPSYADIIVNARILPGDTSASVEEHLRKLAARADVPIANISRLRCREASKVSPHDNHVFKLIGKVLADLYPGAVYTPFLMFGSTDTKHYTALSDNIYRFSPFQISAQEKDTIHSTNEYLSIDNFGRMISFFEQFIGHFDD